MIAAIAIGGWFYYFSDVTSVPEARIGDVASIKKIADEIQAKLKHKTSFNIDLQLIDLASTGWQVDPFIESDLLITEKPILPEKKKAAGKKAVQRPNLLYTGFVEVGTVRLAIINGMEYESGESVGNSGLFVKRIYPSRVEIGKIGTETIFLIPLKEFN